MGTTTSLKTSHVVLLPTGNRSAEGSWHEIQSLSSIALMSPPSGAAGRSRSSLPRRSDRMRQQACKAVTDPLRGHRFVSALQLLVYQFDGLRFVQASFFTRSRDKLFGGPGLIKIG